MVELPLLRRFPGLSALPRVALGAFPTPVQRVAIHDGRILLVKRDDLTGDVIGGNKVRGLEWLLAGVEAGDRVLTVGARGSTHALATALLARRLGAAAAVVRWDQEMNPAAHRVEQRLRLNARVVDARSVALAYVIAAALRARSGRRGVWIPAGGATPRAVLGHVNAALELSEQIARNESERPDAVYVPLGTGGTAAGLALGFRIAGIDLSVIAVRVVPAVIARRGRVLRLANRTAALIERASGERIPRVVPSRVVVEHGFYGGAYGRPLPAPPADEAQLHAVGVRLDDTYSRKAFAAVRASRAERPLLWLTFDGRLIQD